MIEAGKRGVGRPPVITADRLADAATGLVRARGFDALTVGQVAEELGVTTRALYHHIEGLRDLHMMVCDRALEPVAVDIAGLAPAEVIRRSVAELRVVTDEYRGLARFILQFGSLSHQTYRIVDLFIGQFLAGGLDDEAAVKNATLILSWLAGAVIREHAFEDEPVPIGEVHLEALPNIARTMQVFDRMTLEGLFEFEYAAVVEPILERIEPA